MCQLLARAEHFIRILDQKARTHGDPDHVGIPTRLTGQLVYSERELSDMPWTGH